MNDCIFCKIINGDIPSQKVYEDDTVYAFKDINPMAPVHILIVPKEHISTLFDVSPENSAVIAHIYEVISVIAKEQELEPGFRVVSNCNENGGQTVFHIHFHILGGKKLSIQMS